MQSSAIYFLRFREAHVLATSGSDRSYRPDIDGLRAVAILSVVLYHAGSSWFSGGYTGVDIFFVISGYLIGGHIYAELRAGTFTYLNFYYRRAKRILPAFFAIVFFILLAGYFVLMPSEMKETGRAGFYATLSASNIYYFWRIADYFHTSHLSPFLMTWSLGVEEQFYIIIPLLMVLVVRIRRAWLLPAILIVCFVSLLFSTIGLSKQALFMFYMLPSRAWELGAGVALAAAESTRRRITSKWVIRLMDWGGLLLMLAPVFLFSSATPFPGAYALPTVVGTAMVMAFPESWPNRKLLSAGPVVFIGRVSYSWYLWHWPILTYLRIASGGEAPKSSVYAAIAVSLAAAVCSYYFIEQPFRNTDLRPKPLLLRYLVTISATLVVCFGFTKIAPRQFPELAMLEQKASSDTTCLAWTEEIVLSRRCFDPAESRPTIALWGDSHSNALAPALRSIADTNGYGFIQLSRASCLPLSGASIFQTKRPEGAEQCLSFNREVLNILENDSHVKFVVLAAKWRAVLPEPDQWLVESPGERRAPSAAESQLRFDRSLVSSIQALRNAGKQVIIVGDVPHFSFDPLLRARISSRPARKFLATLAGARSDADTGWATPDEEAKDSLTRDEIKAISGRIPGVSVIDLKSSFCTSTDTCMYRDQSRRLLYSDSHHLTPEGARWAFRDFRLPPVASMQ